MALPIWQKARYSAKRDMILPPYLNEDAFDSNLALHLARYGDVEGARKIVDPKDTVARTEIDRLAKRRNYPAEWTRLVVLILHQAHYSLAEANNDGARRVVALHRQLTALMNDNEVRQSKLAVTLLSHGRSLLHESGPGLDGWRRPGRVRRAGQHRPELLGECAGAGAAVSPVAAGTAHPGWAVRARGSLVRASDTLRALDMLELPLPSKAVEGVVGLFEPNRADLGQEILVVYGHLHDVHENRPPGPYWIDEQIGASSRARVPFSMETLVSPRVALVRFAPRTTAVPDSGRFALPRDFGPVHLDRTFEGNRRFFGWSQSGSRLVVNDAQYVAELKWSCLRRPEIHAGDFLIRDDKADLVDDLQFTLQKDPAGHNGLIDVAGPIWQELGAGRIQVTGANAKDNLNLDLGPMGATQLDPFLPEQSRGRHPCSTRCLQRTSAYSTSVWPPLRNGMPPRVGSAGLRARP